MKLLRKKKLLKMSRFENNQIDFLEVKVTDLKFSMCNNLDIADEGMKKLCKI